MRGSMLSTQRSRRALSVNKNLRRLTVAESESVVARLRLAADQAESLQRGLSDRQDDLLALEESVHHMRTGRSTGRVVVDQAEDLRRTVMIQSRDQLTNVRTALTRATVAIVHAATDTSLRPDRAQVLVQVINVAGEEARHAADGLRYIDRALAYMSEANPSDRDLMPVAQRCIDESAKRLEQVRRCAFRIVEDLKLCARAVQNVNQPVMDGYCRTSSRFATTLQHR